MRLPTAAIDAAYHRPAIPVTLALMAGILLGDRLPGWPWPALACLTVGAIHLIICLRRRQPAWLSPLAAVLAAGYLAMVPWRSPLHGPDHISRYLDGDYWRVTATVVEPSRFLQGRTHTVVTAQTLARDAVRHSVSGRIRLTVMGETALQPGDRVRFAARLRPFRNFRNPGSFDYAGHMAARGIHGSAWVPVDALHREGVDPGQRVPRRLADLRRHLGDLIDRCGGPTHPDTRAVLKALVFGDRSGISPDLRERFNRAGVGHLLAISGLHVGIVAAVGFAVWRWLFNLFPALLWRGWGRAWAAGATLIPVAAYAVLAGLSPSTQRAAIMVAVFLASIIAGRTREMFNTLTVAALVILVVFPPALFSAAFRLSFAAVLAIVYGMQKTVTPEPADLPWRRRLIRRLAVFAWVSCLAIAGTAPLVMHDFNQTSLVGVLANLVVVPLAGFVAVPLGLAAALAAVVSDSLATAGFALALVPLDPAVAVVDRMAGLPFAAVTGVTPTLLEIGLYYLAGWSLLNWRDRRRMAWGLAAVLVAGSADGLHWGYQRFWHRDLRVTAIDVGQGGATLLELPGGTVVLVDGGGFADNRQFDVGARIVAPLLWRRKIGQVDILILSHPNADHLNGLIYIARHFGVRELWTNGDTNTTDGYRELMDACNEKRVARRRMDTASTPVAIGDVRLCVMNPPPGFFDSAADGGMDQDLRNSGSLVIHARLGETAVLIPGDITAAAEGEMARREGARLAANVLVAPHHGSRTSSSAALIDAVRPDIVVVSAGAGNRFGFPHDEVTARYRAAGATVLCTGTHGAVFLQADGQRVRYRTVAAGDGDR